MAAPNSPTGVTVTPGGSPESARISWADGGGSPLSYTAYWQGVTGVSDSVYKGSRAVDASRLFVEVEGLPFDKVFATVTATNADGTSAAATEGSGFINP